MNSHLVRSLSTNLPKKSVPQYLQIICYTQTSHILHSIVFLQKKSHLPPTKSTCTPFSCYPAISPSLYLDPTLGVFLQRTFGIDLDGKILIFHSRQSFLISRLGLATLHRQTPDIRSDPIQIQLVGHEGGQDQKCKEPSWME